MNYLKNVYIFDPQSALFASNTAEDKNQIFFYNGKKLVDAPENYIHVPIDDFTSYFTSSSHAYPQELNFDNMNFSDEVINQIIDNLTNALSIVKEARLKELSEIISQEPSHLNSEKFLYKLLEHIKINSLIYEEIPFEVVYKLLEVTLYITNQNINLSSQNLKLAKELNRDLNYEIKSLYTLHLKYGLSILNGLDYTQEYFNFLASFSNVDQLINDFALIKILYPEHKLKEYIIGLGNALFKENFFGKNILQQKYEIFKLYYLTAMHYERGEVYKEIFHILYKVFISALDKELEELVFYLYTPLIMSYNGVAQTQEELKYFNNVVEKPLETFISNTLVTKYKLKKNRATINTNKKIKVGFLQERIINYSIHKVFHLFIKSLVSLNSQQYEFIIYDLNFKEFAGSNTQTVQELKQLGVKYIDLHQECVGNSDEFYSIIQKSLKIRRKIMKDKIDILIGMHSRPEYNFLFTTRTCAKQIYWSHGNFEYDFKSIDAKIYHTLIPKAYSNAYKTFLNPIPIDMYNPHVEKNLIQNSRKLFPKNSFILGSIGRLIKLADMEYLTAISKIMKDNPNTIYLACGSGEQESIKQMVNNLEIADRFYFTGHVDSHLYGHIIDLWLTPFKLGGGEALQEYMYKGKPFVIKSEIYEDLVNMHKEKDKDIYSNIINKNDKSVLWNIYNDENIKNLKENQYLYEENKDFATFLGLTTVATTEDFISVANLLINNKTIRDNIGKEVLFDAKLKNKQTNSSFIKILDEI